MTKIERQKQTVREIIKLYATHKKGCKELTGELKELADYCDKRLEHCRWGEKKPACKNCSSHCYAKEKREEIRKIMRWAGPRMFFYHPVKAIKHLINK